MSLTSGPILPTLLRLALPNVLAMTMTVLVGIAETRYVGLLGTAECRDLTALGDEQLDRRRPDGAGRAGTARTGRAS